MKVGIVSLIGPSNVGKSTILNLLTGYKASIVTHKAQTTRNNIIGVIENDEFQIILKDTPGWQNKINSILSKNMNRRIFEALDTSDVSVLILNAKNVNDIFLKKILDKKIDIIVLNKIDLLRISQVEEFKNKIKSLFDEKIPLIEMCAIRSFNKDVLLEKIISKLSEGKKYSRDIFNKNNNLYVEEIIREKILLLLQKEVPHNIAVCVKNILHKKNNVYIFACILVNKKTQKKIVIGHKGNMIRSIGIKARKELEQYYHKTIFLKLLVKVEENWLNSSKILNTLGY